MTIMLKVSTKAQRCASFSSASPVIFKLFLLWWTTYGSCQIQWIQHDIVRDWYSVDARTAALNCTIVVESSYFQPHLSGNFVTPGYPQGYAAGLQCNWSFIGRAHERIKIEFFDFDVAFKLGAINKNFGSSSCFSADLVIVSKCTNIAQRAQILKQQYCGPQATPLSILSSDISLLEITLSSVHGSRAYRGLHFQYSFVTDYAVQAPLGRQLTPNCHFVFDGSSHRNGSITSPNYPHRYPESLTCLYEFRGRPDDRILVVFDQFEVESDNRLCFFDVDYVSAFVCGQQRRITSNNRLCGTQHNDRKFKIMWGNDCGVMLFHSNSRYVAKGFFARYEFLAIDSLNDAFVENRNDAASTNNEKAVILSCSAALIVLFMGTIQPQLVDII